MIFLSNIPHLKVYKQKAYLPTDQKATTMYSIVFINNDSVQASKELMNNSYLYHNNKFHFYYIDPTYMGKIAGKSYNIAFRKERELVYDDIESTVKTVNSIPTYNGLGGKNVYFDLCKYNAIYFSYAKKLSYAKKVTEYIRFLNKIISNSRFEPYKIKTITIDIGAWMGNNTDLGKKSTFDNPVFILYYAMFKYFSDFKTLGDINIILYNDNFTLRLNPNECDEKSYIPLRKELAKMHPKMVELDDENAVEQGLKKEEVYNTVIDKFSQNFKFTGDDTNTAVDNSVKERMDEIIKDEKIDPNASTEEVQKTLEDKLANDTVLLKKIYTINQEQKTGKTTMSLKRDQELRERQKEIKLDNMSISDLKSKDTHDIAIKSIDISNKVATTNRNLTKVKYAHFENSYNEHLYKKDLVNILTHLNDKSIPVYIRNIDVKDSSDELNYKETYTVEMEDGNRVRHRLVFDMPKFIDDKFMYLGGNKKIINKQLFMKPVVKTGPDEVQICSNYNKIFIRTSGNKVSPKIEKLRKVLLSQPKDIVVKYGSNTATNNNYKTVIEYDELAKDFTYLKIKNTEFYFNQDDVQAKLKQYNKTINNPDMVCIGFLIKEKEPILVDSKTQMLGDMDIVDFILSVAEGKLTQDYDSMTTGKKFMYTKATIMEKHVPVILLLGYCEGLSTVLRKANIKHQFTDKRPKLDNSQGFVKFADGYLVYDKYPFENSLLMNAFSDIPTDAFNYEDFDEKDAYLTIFDIMFNNKLLGNAFSNFYEFMIDPITKEVLEDLNYPTDFVSLVLFANALLADKSFIKENNMNLYRVRSNEIVNALLYKVVADAYISYKLTANNNNPVKISVPPDIVTKNILMLQTVEDYSTLNPIVELEKSRAITPKGPSGMNLADAYTQDKRSYDKTMMGVLSMSTSPDANCGVVRQLTMEPNIVSPRGYLDLKDDDTKGLTDVNLFSPAELLSPLGVTRDDSIRTAMATKQSKHIIPIAKSSPVLISNGCEQVVQYHLGSDFIVRAKMDGQVMEVHADTGIAIVKYKDGSIQAIDTKPRVVKNGAGGFYLSNQLSFNLKKGDKFKEHDIIASDKHFFSDSKAHGNRFNIGSLQKVACLSTYSTFEDSTFVTSKLSKDMAAEIVMQKPVTLGKNANVDFIVKVGDKVKVGDELLRFETSYDDDSLNKFLASVGNELREEIKSLGKTPIKSKYTGIIEDIKIYSTVDLEELSPSLKTLVSDYYAKINKKKAVINKYDKSESIFKAGVLLNEPTDKVITKDGKVKGNIVGEGVLIEFYIKYKDTVGVGDKITFFTALKSIIGEVIPEGQEPFSEHRPDEEISSVIAPAAILARMTPSILLTMFGNKVLVELKRSLQEIYDGKPWHPVKEGVETIVYESMGDIMTRCKHCGSPIGYQEAWEKTYVCPNCSKDYRGVTESIVIEGTEIPVGLEWED